MRSVSAVESTMSVKRMMTVPAGTMGPLMSAGCGSSSGEAGRGGDPVEHALGEGDGLVGPEAGRGDEAGVGNGGGDVARDVHGDGVAGVLHDQGGGAHILRHGGGVVDVGGLHGEGEEVLVDAGADVGAVTDGLGVAGAEGEGADGLGAGDPVGLAGGDDGGDLRAGEELHDAEAAVDEDEVRDFARDSARRR